MCGRYVNPATAEAERYFAVHLIRWKFDRSYNVAPTRQVPVVRLADGQREGLMMGWGLVPFLAKGAPPKYSTIKATIEKLADGPTWRGPWKRCQRCILSAAGFFEWHLNADGSKTPFYITMPPSALMVEIHNAKQRMPAILAAEDIEGWLSGSAEDARTALKPYPDDLMHAQKVSTRVNSPKNNDEQLIATA